MQSTVACLLYESDRMGMCVFDANRYILVSPMRDSSECLLAQSMLLKYGAKLCLVSTTLCPRRYKLLSEIDIEYRQSKAVDYRRISVAEPFLLSGKCLSALACHLGHQGFISSKKAGIAGYIGGRTVYYEADGCAMVVPKETLAALGIAQSRDSQAMQILSPLGIGHHSKKRHEERTFFELIDSTATVPGRRTLRAWLISPLRSKEDILLRHKKQKRLRPLVSLLVAGLKRCRCGESTDLPGLERLGQVLAAAVELSRLTKGAVVLKNKAAYLKLAKRLAAIEHGRIKDGYDSQIDELRKIIRDLPAVLNKEARLMADKHGAELSVLYFPQLGYLVESKRELEGRLFSIKNKSYYKTEEMRCLDMELGDAEVELSHREAEVITALRNDVQSADLGPLIDYIGEVDALCSMIVFAEAHGCRPPLFTENEVIKIGHATNAAKRTTHASGMVIRHSDANRLWKVADLTVNRRAIAADAENLLTELGQIVVLAQAGFSLPYKRLELPLFDNVLVKMRQKDSVHRDQSTFLAEVAALAEVFNLCSSKSLCLLDSPGRGTNYADSMAILMGCTAVLPARILAVSIPTRLVDGPRDGYCVINQAMLDSWKQRFAFYRRFTNGAMCWFAEVKENAAGDETSDYACFSPDFIQRIREEADRLAAGPG
ncbi:DNA mismatch repair protein MutS [Pancytospora philotis]|nr:DNA mismatch repair protein MutS [Pancytospora philotis]